MKNKNSVCSWSRILTLADNARGSSAVSLGNHVFFGKDMSLSGVMEWIKSAHPNMLIERSFLLKNEPYIAICYDNYQKYFFKVSVYGRVKLL
mmetsp:Transcript_14013/g.27959  ORF Transcript_14013/g.27959 Transcript_14013/m.27959 type:complete len:92 (-) Transcript_14013:71-346(-)